MVGRVGCGEQAEADGVDLHGRIDEFAIYDHALDEGQIRMVFDAGSTGKCRP